MHGHSNQVGQGHEEVIAIGSIMEENNVPISIQNAMAQLAPPATQNTITAFFLAQVEGHLGDGNVDIGKYWEKRRIQNAMRRLLEHLEESFEIPDASKSKKKVDERYSDFFDVFLRHSP